MNMNMMRNYINILKQRITIGSFLSTIATVLLGYVFRNYYEYIFDTDFIRGYYLDLDLYYVMFLGTFRAMFGAFLECVLGEFYTIPLAGYKPPISIYMDNKDLNKPDRTSKGKGYSKNTDFDNKSSGSSGVSKDTDTDNKASGVSKKTDTGNKTSDVSKNTDSDNKSSEFSKEEFKGIIAKLEKDM